MLIVAKNRIGNTFLAMGGCKSSQKWKDQGLWWQQELPTEEEIKRAYESLEKHSHSVDYVLTHKYHYNSSYTDASLFTLEGFTHYVSVNVRYKHWYWDIGTKTSVLTKNTRWRSMN